MSRQTVSGSLLHAGVDWLTCTQEPGARAEMMKGLARYTIEREAQAGQIIRDWQWRGYTGEASPQLTWGERSDGIVVKLVGATAQLLWRRFARMAKGFPRIDLQATVLLTPADFSLGAMHRLEAINRPPTRGKPPTISWIETHGGGFTLYLGRRASDVLARVYDKSAQDSDGPHPNGTWRYEMEYKRERARAVVRRLLAQPEGAQPVLAILHHDFTSRGLTVTFPSVHSDPVPLPPRYTDEETRLRWLADAVRPTVQWLRSRGRGQEVRRILGLPVDFREED